MPNGRVKWFDAARGYGFIIPDAERSSAHASAPGCRSKACQSATSSRGASLSRQRSSRGGSCLQHRGLTDDAEMSKWRTIADEDGHYCFAMAL
jgi:hypothetical protein